VRALGLIVVDMGNGLVFGKELTFVTAFPAVSGAFAGAAFIITLLMLRRSSADSEGPVRGGRAEVPVYVVFWALVELALAGAFVLNDTPVAGASIRYLIPGFYAMAAVVPVWAARSATRRTLVAMAVTLYAAVATQALHDATVADAFELPWTRHQPEVLAVLQTHHLTHGYASFWGANSLTWNSHGRVAPRAVRQGADCNAPDPGVVCPYRYFAVESWFAPRPGPSFLLVDRDDPYVNAAPSAALGSPTAVYAVGRRTVYVFPYDLATRWR
jgi:hypothetical protein